MYQFYPSYQTPQQYHPLYTAPYQPSSIISPQYPLTPQYSIEHLNPNETDYITLNKDPRTLSQFELTQLLNRQTRRLKILRANDPEKQLPIIIDVINVLIRVPKSKLVSSVRNDFFSLLRTPFIDVLNQSSQVSVLSNDEFYTLRVIVKLIQRIIEAVDDLILIPSWFIDSTVLETISTALTSLINSEDILQKNNKALFKPFTHLIDAYLVYQKMANQQNHTQADLLATLLDPILNSLTSSHFINAFNSLSIDAKSMTTTEKFFLIKCPTFLTSYNGSRLEQSIDNLLSTMVPKYAQLLDKLVRSAQHWKRAMMRAIDHLLQMINHGTHRFQTNTKHVSDHLALIDSVLKLVDEPTLYKNLQGTLSNPETNLMNTVLSFLVNMIVDPAVLGHIKQSQMTNAFLRLTTCEYEPLVLHVYALLAYTTNEEDIKAMPDPGRLFAAIIQSLKTSLKQAPNKNDHNEELLETLKGLVQHEQMKDEVIKQNALPFLLECSKKLTGRSQTLILETLWSLTFREENASILRSNPQFLQTIQNISTSSKTEPLKKAADGVLWKLVRESAHLKNITKQEAGKEKETGKEAVGTIIEEVVTNDGQKQLIKRVKPAISSPEEGTFQYDIMISYCHADKELTYKIHQFLVDLGFKVWIDYHNMYGPAMNAMSEAVENSEFVIMCMSDSYKRSTYCQAEAEYAFKCKRRLIPLIVSKGYRPDGWLGFMIGSRIYVDFGRFDFKTGSEKLLTEITLQRKQPLQLKASQISQQKAPSSSKAVADEKRVEDTPHYHDEKPIQEKSPYYDEKPMQEKPPYHDEKPIQEKSPYHDEKPMQKKPPYHDEKPTPQSVVQKNFQIHLARKVSSDFTRKPIINWAQSDVLDFLYTQHLVQMMPLCEEMNGGALIELYKMCLSRSSKTYALLSYELKSTYKIKLPIAVYTRFINTIEEYLTVQPALPSVKRPMLSLAPLSMPVGLTLSKYAPPTAKLPVVINTRVQTPSNADQGYNLVITSDASPLIIMEAVSKYGANLEKMFSILSDKDVQY